MKAQASLQTQTRIEKEISACNLVLNSTRLRSFTGNFSVNRQILQQLKAPSILAQVLVTCAEANEYQIAGVHKAGIGNGRDLGHVANNADQGSGDAVTLIKATQGRLDAYTAFRQLDDTDVATYVPEARAWAMP